VTGMEHALEKTLQYMSEREAFGRPINRFQVLRHKIAQMASEIEALKAFSYHCCRLYNDDVYDVKLCSMAKLLATELCEKVATQCLQMFGGYGFMEEYPMARMYRDVRVGTIGGGTSEIMRDIIAKIIIDGQGYKQARSNGAPRKATQNGKQNGISNNQTNQIFMSFEAIKSAIEPKASAAPAFGKKLKFDLGDNKLFIDGTGDSNVVSESDDEADCVIVASIEDFQAMMSGDLNPMSAVMGGKVKIKGDMGLAMKLQSLIK